MAKRQNGGKFGEYGLLIGLITEKENHLVKLSKGTKMTHFHFSKKDKTFSSRINDEYYCEKFIL